jgi:hypothetical protein
MTKSSTRTDPLQHSDIPAASDKAEAARSSNLGFSGEAAGDVDAIVAEQGDNETVIRRRAYAIWEIEGRPDGRHREHWDRARHELAMKS